MEIKDTSTRYNKKSSEVKGAEHPSNRPRWARTVRATAKKSKQDTNAKAKTDIVAQIYFPL